MLKQQNKIEWKAKEIASQLLNNTIEKHSNKERDLQGTVWQIDIFKHLLYGTFFIVNHAIEHFFQFSKNIVLAGHTTADYLVGERVLQNSFTTENLAGIEMGLIYHILKSVRKSIKKSL